METCESAPDRSCPHQAVARLYELARDGDTDSGEYLQLDSLVYEGLQRRYGVQPPEGGSGHTPRRA